MPRKYQNKSLLILPQDWAHLTEAGAFQPFASVQSFPACYEIFALSITMRGISSSQSPQPSKAPLVSRELISGQLAPKRLSWPMPYLGQLRS